MINTKDGISMSGNRGGSVNAGAPIPIADALRAHAAYMQLPDMRMDKVLEIQRRMAAGRFDPSAEDLADAILNAAAGCRLCR